MTDTIVFAGCFSVLAFLIGVEVGKAIPPECPKVQGQRVISSSKKNGENFCTYATTKGMKTKERKI